MNRYIALMWAVGLSANAVSVMAQKKLIDADSVRVDLGFGVEQTLANSPAAVSVITGDELRTSGAVNLSDALYGRLLGLTTLKTGGFQGDDNYGASLNVRGYQTLSENNLLILVDGVQRPIDHLSVNEVESVTVLKDAAAVALLGYEGVNGALLVKTRRGKEGKMKIDVGYRHEFLFSPKVSDFTDAYGYATALNEARLNDGLGAAYSPLELELFKSGTDPYYYPDVNWKDAVLKDNASEDEVNLSVSGGNKNDRYFTILDYTDARGALKGTDQTDFNSQLKYSKANIRANLDFKVTPTTFMNVNMLASFIETNRPASGYANDIMYQIYKLPSTAFPVSLPDGTWGGNSTFGDANPVARVQSSGKEKTHQRALYADAKLTQRLDFIVDGLSASLRVAYDNMSSINERHGKSFQYGFLSYGGTIGDKDETVTTVYGDKINNLSFSKWLGNQWRSNRFDFTVNYDHTFGDHWVSAAFIYNTVGIVGMNRYNTINRANVMGYLGYVWRKRLAASVTLGGNGSNRSYPHKWSFSPTASVAYTFANDMENPVLNMGKVRGSFGIQHSDYVPVNVIWLENYDGGHGNIVLKPNYDGNNWGNYLSHYPLSDFALETAYKYDLGIDLRLFGCLDFTLDGYYNRRSNIMMKADDLNSWIVGRPNSYATEGRVDSYGVEAGLSFVKSLSKDFSINAGAMITWGRNEIKSYIELPAEQYQSHIGQRTDQAYGLQAIGFFKDEADIASSPVQQFSNVSPGDIKYKDQNGDGIINEHDAVYFGYGQNIPEINYAFSIGAEWKGIGVNAIFQGVSGLTKWLGTTGVWSCLRDNTNLSQHYYDNAWHPGSDNTNALYPRLTTQDNPNNSHASSVWYDDISWLKLRHVEIYYRLPSCFVRKLAMSDARIYVQGNNLFTFSNMKVMDPEVLGTSYPVFKGINLGLIVNF